MHKDILYPLRRFHGWLHDYPEFRREKQKYKERLVRPILEQLKLHPDAVFLVMTPDHGNLGDQAIACAEQQMLERAGIAFVEITYDQIYYLVRYGLTGIFCRRTVLVHGGGYLGTIWHDAEILLRRLLLKTTDSSVILLPNTVYYEQSPWGEEELCQSIGIYNANKSLIIYTREKNSFEFMRPIYRDVRLMPDMVMSLTADIPVEERRGCLLCLRGDCEKTRTEDQENVLRQQAEMLFGNEVQDTDTVLLWGISREERPRAVQEKLEQFARAELVITDRLHGMIFCAITGTPCIVVNSKSPKVRGCYAWIQNLEYIRFAEDVSRIGELYRSIPAGPHRYENSHLLPYFDELTEVVKAYAANQRDRSRI